MEGTPDDASGPAVYASRPRLPQGLRRSDTKGLSEIVTLVPINCRLAGGWKTMRPAARRDSWRLLTSPLPDDD